MTGVEIGYVRYSDETSRGYAARKEVDSLRYEPLGPSDAEVIESLGNVSFRGYDPDRTAPRPIALTSFFTSTDASGTTRGFASSPFTGDVELPATITAQQFVRDTIAGIEEKFGPGGDIEAVLLEQAGRVGWTIPATPTPE